MSDLGKFIGGFNIEEFRSRIATRGIQKNNKFLVTFNAPLTVKNFSQSFDANNIDRQLRFWTDSASIPGVMLATRQLLRYGYGAMEKKPVSPVFNDISFSIMNDGTTLNLIFFQEWIQYIVQYNASKSMGDTNDGNGVWEIEYKNNYMTDMNVMMFNDSGKQILNIVLREAYPIHVADIPLNWADNSNVQRVPVTFTFMDWYNLDLSDTGQVPIETPLK